MRFFRLLLSATALLSVFSIAQAQSAVSAPQVATEYLPQPQDYLRQTILNDLQSPQTAYQPAQQLVMLENQLLPTVLHLMKQRQWLQAKSILTPLLETQPASLHALFLAGQIAEQQQDWQSAVTYYRQMLAIDRTLQRPRLELAKALAKSGEIQASEYQFNLALSQKLPPQVENNVFSILQNLKAETSYLNVQFAFMPSSNINQGSRQRTVMIRGVSHVLSESSRAKSGVGVQLAIDGEKRFGNEYKWFINGALLNLDYANRHSDQTVSRLMIGRSFGNQRHAWDIAVGGHHVLYQHKGLYQGMLGRVNYAWRIKPDWKLSLGWETQQLHYQPQYAYQRGWQHWFNANLSHVVNGRTIYYWGVQQGFNQAKERNYSNRTLTLQTGVRHQFDFAQLTMGANLAYGRTDYRDVVPFLDMIRHDKRWSGSVDILKRDWSWLGFAPRLSLHYTDNRSNTGIYSYKNKQVRLSFSKEF
ncbi:Cytochrome c biogenesis factor [Pasteurella testudinis DSM 23072]|uniref:Cytochrome c biogenesis factor n=1 Tax=Pasteurella testudinis DSM 23072 TaxID=1122938 RepID=A0A1W1UJ01_9PAST|nr:surface lipoprotein assembly modifier [Pasteurella testudinis]SMB80781.1 Cytochrome c biogenesis factor [Pasteurella testudinis DSM 23072]SUB52311.1 TPR repeat-containing protein NMB0313 precursor [Pasteurella testudinis]